MGWVLLITLNALFERLKIKEDNLELSFYAIILMLKDTKYVTSKLFC